MIDLFVHVADRDAENFLQSVFKRHEALKTRPFKAVFNKNNDRDNGVVIRGDVVARTFKGKYQKCLMICDHQGSGKERQSALCLEYILQNKLDLVTWSGNSKTLVLDPELEIWIMRSPSALQTFFNITMAEYETFVREISVKYSLEKHPKEILNALSLKFRGHVMRTKDFEDIGTRASISALQASPSFKALNEQLKEWFPLI